jgi:hypothetical protein
LPLGPRTSHSGIRAFFCLGNKTNEETRALFGDSQQKLRTRGLMEIAEKGRNFAVKQIGKYPRRFGANMMRCTGCHPDNGNNIFFSDAPTYLRSNVPG